MCPPPGATALPGPRPGAQTGKWPGQSHGGDTYHADNRLHQLVTGHLHPGHFNSPRVPGRARRQEIIHDSTGGGAGGATDLHGAGGTWHRAGVGDSSHGALPRTTPTHLLEVRGRLHLAHGLHQGVPHDDADVGPRVAVGLAGQLLDVGVRQGVRGVPQVQPEHLRPRRLLGQGDVDPLLEPGSTRGEPQFQPCWGAATGAACGLTSS